MWVEVGKVNIMYYNYNDQLYNYSKYNTGPYNYCVTVQPQTNHPDQ